MRGAATNAGVGSPRRSGNKADGPAPPEPEGRQGVAADLGVAPTLGGDGMRRPTPPAQFIDDGCKGTGS
jgi:hypothetical protein